MSQDQEPTRWKDAGDAPARVRDLLRETSALGPMPKELFAAIFDGLPGGAPGSPPNATPGETGSRGAATGTTGTSGKGILASAAIPTAAAGVAIAIVAALASNAPLTTTPSAPAEAPSSNAVLEAPPNAANVPAPAVEPPSPAASPLDLVASSASTSLKRGSARGAPTADLGEESALLGRARAALASTPASSLAAIDEHARRFPRGELAPEREYLRVSVLQKLGRRDEARARARSYLAKYPSSPHTAAVRSILAELESP